MKKSKYNVDQSDKGKQNRTYRGICFDSKLECDFYKYLLSLQEQGIIKSIEMQPNFLLQDKFIKYGRTILPIFYKADFQVTFNDKSVIIYDVKGMVTPESRLKAKIFNYVYSDKILKYISYSRIDGGWVDLEVITKGRKERKKAKDKKVKTNE